MVNRYSSAKGPGRACRQDPGVGLNMYANLDEVPEETYDNENEQEQTSRNESNQTSDGTQNGATAEHNDEAFNLKSMEENLPDDRKDSGVGDPEDDEGFTEVKKVQKKDSTKQWFLPIILAPETPAEYRERQTVLKKGATALKLAKSRLSRMPGKTKLGTQSQIPQGILLKDLKPGIIFQHYDVSEFTGVDPSSAAGQVFFSPTGIPYIEKPRLAVIFDVHAFNFEEVYFYTYEGQGLKNKPDDLKEEHMGVVPYGMKLRNWTKDHKENNHPPLIIQQMMEKDFVISPISVCLFTEAHSFRPNRKGHIIGQVTDESFGHLLHLRRQFSSNGRQLQRK